VGIRRMSASTRLPIPLGLTYKDQPTKRHQSETSFQQPNCVLIPTVDYITLQPRVEHTWPFAGEFRLPFPFDTVLRASVSDR